VKVFTLATRIADPDKNPLMARIQIRIIGKLAGLLGGVHTDAPVVILCFGTKKHAEKARDELLRRRWPVGKYIMTAEMDRDWKSLKIGAPADGWNAVDAEDLQVDRDGNRGVRMQLEG
jgi:hypothetical protein